jgi:hypothetical protein
MRKPFIVLGIFLIIFLYVSAFNQDSEQIVEAQGTRGIYSISPAELVPLGGLLDHVNYEMDYHRGWTNAYPRPNQWNTFTFAAPVHLPNRARVKRVEVFVTDDDDENFMEVTLRRAKFDTLATDVYLAILSSDGLTSSPDRTVLVDDNIDYSVIDNGNYSYVLLISYYDPAAWLIFHGAKIVFRSL